MNNNWKQNFVQFITGQPLFINGVVLRQQCVMLPGHRRNKAPSLQLQVPREWEAGRGAQRLPLKSDPWACAGEAAHPAAGGCLGLHTAER